MQLTHRHNHHASWLVYSQLTSACVYHVSSARMSAHRRYICTQSTIPLQSIKHYLLYFRKEFALFDELQSHGIG
jgi:hypothetical protein